MLASNNSGPVLKITCKTDQDAKNKLFSLYNNNYRIIDKKPVLKGGFLGFGQHEEIEFSYVIDNRRSQASSFAAAPRISSEGVTSNETSALYEAFEKSRGEILNKMDSSKTISSGQIQDIVDKLSEVLDKKFDERSAAVSSNGEDHETISKIQELLAQNEFTYAYIKYITDLIKKNFSLEELNDFTLVQNKVVEWIGESIQTYTSKQVRKPVVTILVGPTGVGKTTTLVKLAAQYYIKHKAEYDRIPSIKFISTDSMRTGAYDQLKTYAEQFGPHNLFKADTAEDILQIYKENKDSIDALFIDTSGYSPNDASHIGAMKEMLSVPGINPEIYLVFDAKTKARDLHNIMQNYEIFGYNSIILTKCDESSQYGNVLSVLHERRKPISYFTDGQNPARCISEANIISFLIRLEGFEIDTEFRTYLDDKFGEK
ncbi:MAG: hypothetical protein IIT58_00240 [Treponema sp.]|nr:hypothetical protein [Treponema sp.]